MEVGLYFGTFDPIHNGHLALAGYVLGQQLVEELWFVPSPQSPYKQDRLIAPAADRCAAIRRVIDRLADPRLALCDVELELPTPSYTICTLRELHRRYPSVRFTLVMGADSAVALPQWREGSTIASSYRVLVYPRRGHPLPPSLLSQYPLLEAIDAPLVEISSTAIREGRVRGQNMDFYTPLV